jgi:hypothetical protein
MSADEVARDEHLADYQERSAAAQAKADQAFSRLLGLAETRDSGQTPDGSVPGLHPQRQRLPLGCIRPAHRRHRHLRRHAHLTDCLRWAKLDLFNLVSDGDRRVLRIAQETIRIAVTAGPHAQIAEVAKKVAERDGLTLKIVEFQD